MVNTGIPQVGEEAPDFELEGARGQRVRLYQELERGPVIVYFYAAAFGYLCNAVIREIAAVKDQLDELGVELLAVSTDDARIQGVWKERMKIPFPLLSDPEGEVCQRYGVLIDDEVMRMSNRAVFLVDADGIVRYQWVAPDPAWKPDVEELVQAVSDLDADRCIGVREES
ncbi:MAG: redoxin domain-containing protein [Methanomassiliicoccales archaeon]